MTNPACLANNFKTEISMTIDPAMDSRLVSERASRRSFFGALAMLFVVSAAVTAVWCGSMSAMGAMPMPGGWTMSMAWMRMPGETWAGAAASFLAMWVVMMVAMMLPSLAPMLCRYRQSIETTRETLRAPLAAFAGLGYFSVWTLFGLAIFPLGAMTAAVEMQQPALARVVPMVAGVIILIAGALQFTAWKAHHLARCRKESSYGRTSPANFLSAWRQGIRFGFHCTYSCLNLTAILLVIGVMDLRAMAIVAAGITAERLAPEGQGVARAIGFVAVGAGVLLIAKAGGLG